MKTFHLLAGALALAFALAAVGGAAARSQASTIRIGAAMTAANETPSPKGDVSGAHGTFTATLTKTATGAEMSWRLGVSKPSGDAIPAPRPVAARGGPGPAPGPRFAPRASGRTRPPATGRPGARRHPN